MTDDSSLFELPQQQQLCPLCQQPLTIKSGKNGPFLGCSAYPACNYIKALHQHETSIVKVLDSEACPQCGNALAIEHGRQRVRRRGLDQPDIESEPVQGDGEAGADEPAADDQHVVAGGVAGRHG